MLVLLLALSLPAAPAPPPKPPAIPAIKAGRWLMTWSATDCPAWFHEGGHYSCLWNGRWWAGRWMQEKGVLTVEEWPAETPATVLRWEVRLACPRTGVMNGGSPFKLGDPLPEGPVR